jgi:uncharacterized protein YbjT (DUF2867 family)
VTDAILFSFIHIIWKSYCTEDIDTIPDGRIHRGTEDAMLMVTGATGTVGLPLVESLVGEGVKVRAVTRDPASAGLPAEVDVIGADPSRPDTIVSALDGVTALFLSPPAVGNAAGELLALARDRGVRRAVLLSALAVEYDQHARNAIVVHHRALEDTLLASGLEWVILRPGMFATNTIAEWATQIRAADVVIGPYAQSTAAPVDERDIAVAATRALLDDDLVGQRLRLTGPESLTTAQLVAVIGAVIGRPLRYREIPPEEARSAMTARGVPTPMVNATLSMQAHSIGHPATVTTDTANLLGRRAHTFAEWVAAHVDAFTA